MVDRVEERPDIRIENMPDVASFDPVRERPGKQIRQVILPF
jgi:hypothetical protein